MALASLFSFQNFQFYCFQFRTFQPRINCDGQFFLAPNRMEKENDFDMKQMLKYIHWKVPLYLDEKLSILPSPMRYWKREWRSTLSIPPHVAAIEGQILRIYQRFQRTGTSRCLINNRFIINFSNHDPGPDHINKISA